jgi:hypothetical protein
MGCFDEKHGKMLLIVNIGLDIQYNIAKPQRHFEQRRQRLWQEKARL